MSEIATDTKLLVDLVNGLETTVASMTIDLEPDLICWTMIEDANRTLSSIRHTLTNRLGKAMPSDPIVDSNGDPVLDEKTRRPKTKGLPVTVEGIGTFIRHGEVSRTTWDKDTLLRAVLDTRLINPDTGEILDPNAIDKVLHVWNLPAPRVTALKTRGLDPDEFCHAEWAGWQIELKS